MFDPELLAIMAHHQELQQEAARLTLAKRVAETQPAWRERWRHHVQHFLSLFHVRDATLPTMHLAPAVACAAHHRQRRHNV